MKRRVCAVTAGVLAATTIVFVPSADADSDARHQCKPTVGRFAGDGVAVDINNHGLVVGQGGADAVIWRNGRRRIIARDATAAAVNDHGVVVGTQITADGSRAFRWKKGDLTLLPGFGDAWGVNDHGLIVGRAGVDGVESPALWRGQHLTALPLDNEGQGGYAIGVNNRGQLIGYSRGVGSWRWTKGEFAFLGPGYYPGAIDATGRMGGGFDYEDGQVGSPVVWSADLVPQVIPAAGGLGRGTDGDGRFVGGLGTMTLLDDSTLFEAAVYDDARGIRALPSLTGEPVPSSAAGANLSGTVVGNTTIQGTRRVPTIWRCAWGQAAQPN